MLEAPGWIGHSAGQHVDVRLTAEDGYQTQRSYSIASPPEDRHIMLTVERLDDGEVSPRLVVEQESNNSDVAPVAIGSGSLVLQGACDTLLPGLATHVVVSEAVRGVVVFAQIQCIQRRRCARSRRGHRIRLGCALVAKTIHSHTPNEVWIA